ncbi:MAG: helix-turn-helix transcriptional regulator [Candidatus Atribacteria bacterium]|nr:helix-turn-helix transcriptional regulator [Candidatus Atribacteria bacterium]
MTERRSENRIQRARRRAKLTQAQAAQRAGWSQGQWSDLERGRFPAPTLATLRRAAKALGCSLTALIGKE